MTDETTEEKPKKTTRKKTQDDAAPAENAAPENEYKPRFDEDAPAGLVGKC